MGMSALGYTPGVLLQEAEVVERNGDDVFSRAKERAERAGRVVCMRVRRGRTVKVTTKVRIYGE
jgi:hypothetical protein